MRSVCSNKKSVYEKYAHYVAMKYLYIMYQETVYG